MPRRDVRAMRLQKRDLAVFAEIASMGLSTRKQLALSCFGGSYDAAKKRLHVLIHNGFISEDRRCDLGVSLLRLHKTGWEHLQRAHESADRLTNLLICKTGFSKTVREHEIGVRDVRAAFTHAVRTHPALGLPEFHLSRSMTTFSVPCKQHRRPEAVRPDAYLILREVVGSSRDQCFFLELDRSTESQLHLAHLAKLYMEFFRTGGYALLTSHFLL